MHLTTVFGASLALGSVPGILGYPGMGGQLSDIMSRDTDDLDSTELIGDLVELDDSDLTKVGKDIKGFLQETGGDPESDEEYEDVPPKDSKKCKDDPCCIWKYVADDMHSFMRGKSGRCTKWARFAVRLGFHDAGTWSKSTASEGQGGGADGSIILSGTELSRPSNDGLEEIGERFGELHEEYRGQGWDISMADLIQLGHNVATVTCPLGPRIRTYVGREDSSEANPDDLLPSVFASADSLVELFADKTIRPNGLVALVGAHSTSQQRFVNESRAGDPQDSTPGVWDVKFYGETTSDDAPERVFKFPSDVALSQHRDTSAEWEAFSGDGGQGHWNADYAREYIRLSLLGVDKINELTECTKVLPSAVGSFRNPDQERIDSWLSTDSHEGNAEDISEDLRNGDLVEEDVSV